MKNIKIALQEINCENV